MASRLMFNLHEQMALARDGSARLDGSPHEVITPIKFTPSSDQRDDHFIQTIRDSSELRELELADVRRRSKSIHTWLGTDDVEQVEIAATLRRRSHVVLDDGVYSSGRSFEVVSGVEDDRETLELQWATPHVSSGYSAQSSS